MRILMVTQFYSPTVGGQERVVEDLSRELIARGHHVAVVALQQGDLPDMSEVAGVPVYRIRSTAARFFRGYADPTRPHSPPAVDPGAMRELRRVLRLEKPTSCTATTAHPLVPAVEAPPRSLVSS